MFPTPPSHKIPPFGSCRNTRGHAPNLSPGDGTGLATWRFFSTQFKNRKPEPFIDQDGKDRPTKKGWRPSKKESSKKGEDLVECRRYYDLGIAKEKELSLYWRVSTQVSTFPLRTLCLTTLGSRTAPPLFLGLRAVSPLVSFERSRGVDPLGSTPRKLVPHENAGGAYSILMCS